MLPIEGPYMRAQLELPHAFTLLAVFTFSMTGALVALRRGYDIVGVLSLALITASGGGLIRDGVLLSGKPVAFLTDPLHFGVILGAAILTCFFHRFVDRLGRTVAVIDAVGLGAFAATGSLAMLDAGLGAAAAVLGGTITAVGGGLLRDILVREEPLLFKPGQFYAVVAIGGSCLFLALLRWSPLTTQHSAIVTVVVVFVVRVLVIRFRWTTTALYREPTPPA